MSSRNTLKPTLKKRGKLSFTSDGILQVCSQQPCTSIAFMGLIGVREGMSVRHAEVGRLNWGEGHLTFCGYRAESAQIFFDEFLKPLVDEYIQRTA